MLIFTLERNILMKGDVCHDYWTEIVIFYLRALKAKT